MRECSSCPNPLRHTWGSCILEIKRLSHVAQLMAKLRWPSAAQLPRLAHFPLPNSWEHIMDEIKYHTQGLGFPLLEVTWHWQILSSRVSLSGMQRSDLSSTVKGGLERKRLEAGSRAKHRWHCSCLNQGSGTWMPWMGQIRGVLWKENQTIGRKSRAGKWEEVLKSNCFCPESLCSCVTTNLTHYLLVRRRDRRKLK